VHELHRVFDGDDVVGRERLTRSMSAQSVVDLPDPVGPVTSTRPLVSWQSRCTSGEMPICSTVTTEAGM
jgi:hypothetical protein